MNTDKTEAFDAGTNNVQVTNANHGAAVDMKSAETQTNALAGQLNANPKTDSANLNPNKVPSVIDNAKLPNMGNRKKPSSGSSSFFDR